MFPYPFFGVVSRTSTIHKDLFQSAVRPSISLEPIQKPQEQAQAQKAAQSGLIET